MDNTRNNTRNNTRLQPADRAWITLGVGVLLYDMLAEDGQTMSERADAYLLSRPWLTRTIGVAVTCHVLNVLSPEYDVIHWLFTLTRKWRRP